MKVGISATSLRTAFSPQNSDACAAMARHLEPAASCHQAACLIVKTLTVPSLLSPVKHMNSNGVLPTQSLHLFSSTASLRKRGSGSEAYYVAVSSLLPSTKRTSTMFIPAPDVRSSRILDAMAMRSKRCICCSCNMSAIVVVGTGACGKSVLCSSACAGVLRRSIAMRHGV